MVPNIQVSKDDGALCTMYPCSLSPEFLIESTPVERGDHIVPNIQVSKDDRALCKMYPCSLRPEFLIESTTKWRKQLVEALKILIIRGFRSILSEKLSPCLK